VAKRFRFVGMPIVRAGILIAAGAGSVSSQLTSARDVVLHFCTRDAQGEQLTAESRQRLAAMFTAPGNPERDKLMVIRGFVVSRAFPENNRIGFRVDYTPVGWIDPFQKQFHLLPPTIELRGDFFVTEESKYATTSTASHVENSPGWRIEGPMPAPHLTIEAAIRYANRLRAQAKDPALKKRATELLAALVHVSQSSGH
jgi:hypothetical protein